MKNLFKLTLFAAVLSAATFTSCQDAVDGKDGKDGIDGVDGKDGKDGADGSNSGALDLSNPLAKSKTPNFLKLEGAFSSVKITPILTSEDIIPSSPKFVYGSMADGAGLLKNDDGETYTLINNIEADYSVARIILNKDLQPVKGEYILNANATAFTAQCSGSLITPEEHGFGPLYLSGGEWGGSSKGVFVTSPTKNRSDADFGRMLDAFGQWSTENAVVIGKDAYPRYTVALIGDDTGSNKEPVGDLGIYVGRRGDLQNGKLYGLKVIDTKVEFEMDMDEGVTYEVEFVELIERDYTLLEKECREKGIIGFSRVEDIDWRRGSAAANREVYFCVTGRRSDDLKDKGTEFGRVYKLELNEDDKNPTGNAKLTCVLDGDKLDGKAKEFLSPDNIVVSENYAYIQEDPNYKNDPTANKGHFASLYQYDLNSGNLVKVLECDQKAAEAAGYGSVSSYWELTGMIDVSEVTGKPNTFMLITQNHGWVPADGSAFTDPKANPDVKSSRKEGSMLYLVEGLQR